MPHPGEQVTKPVAAPALRSGELARSLGVSRDTLRHYEKQGLLPRPLRSAGGYRLYPPQTVERIRLIRGALAIGFSVETLRRILQQRDTGGTPCQEVLQAATQTLAEVEHSIADLNRLRDLLAEVVRGWKKRMRGSRGRPARLLENFVAEHPENAEALSPLLSPGLRRRLVKVRRK